MKNVIQLHGDQVGSAADENDISHFGKMQNRIGDFMDQSPGGRVEAKKFVHGVGYSRNPVLGHEPREPAGQMLQLEDLFNQIAIEDRPGFSTLRRLRDMFEELLSDRVASRTALARDSDGAK